jgi:hypothetical protein
MKYLGQCEHVQILLRMTRMQLFDLGKQLFDGLAPRRPEFEEPRPGLSNLPASMGLSIKPLVHL